MQAYKLFRKRKNGTLGPLFISKTQVIEPNVWLPAKAYRTKRFAFRPGWHCCSKCDAPISRWKGGCGVSLKSKAWKRLSDPLPKAGYGILPNV